MSRRRPTLALVAAFVVAATAAACGGQDDASEPVETERTTGDLASAVSAAQAAMPVELPDSRVRVLLEDLCGAGADDAEGIVEQLAALPVTDAAQVDQVLAALHAGTSDLCPGDVAAGVADAVAAGARAAAPPTTAAAAASAAASSGGSSGPAASTQSSSTASGGTSGTASAGTSGGSGAPSNSSSGSAAVGSGNASGSGNQSSTNFGQNVTSDPSTTTTPTP